MCIPKTNNNNAIIGVVSSYYKSCSEEEIINAHCVKYLFSKFKKTKVSGGEKLDDFT